MSRRNKAVKRPVPPDPRYDSQTVSKFVNNLMFEGKKSVAEGIFYSAMDLIEERTGQPGVAVFKQAVNNSKPTLEVKSRRVGGASLQVPVEVVPIAARRWRCDGSFPLPAPGPRRRCRSGWRRNSSWRRRARGIRSRRRKTPTVWPRRTGRSRIIAGKRLSRATMSCGNTTSP